MEQFLQGHMDSFCSLFVALPPNADLSRLYSQYFVRSLDAMVEISL